MPIDVCLQAVYDMSDGTDTVLLQGSACHRLMHKFSRLIPTYRWFSPLLTTACVDEGVKEGHGSLIAHEQAGISVIHGLTRVLDDGGLRVELHTHGATLVGPFDTLHSFDVGDG